MGTSNQHSNSRNALGLKSPVRSNLAADEPRFARTKDSDPRRRVTGPRGYSGGRDEVHRKRVVGTYRQFPPPTVHSRGAPHRAIREPSFPPIVPGRSSRASALGLDHRFGLPRAELLESLSFPNKRLTSIGSECHPGGRSADSVGTTQGPAPRRCPRCTTDWSCQGKIRSRRRRIEISTERK